MARVATAGELTLFRTAGQWARLFLAIHTPETVYTAELDAVPSSTDRVVEITFVNGSGTLGDCLQDMAMYVGTSAGGYDLGVVRLRKAPIAGTFYVNEVSEVNWAAGGTIYLTVVDEFRIEARHLYWDGAEEFMDYDVDYSDQNEVMNPVPVLGPHAVLWLTGASVDFEPTAADSWVLGSTISGYSWSAPTASGSSGMTTATPTITFDTTGVHRVSCTVTAASGATQTGHRYVFIFDADDYPYQVVLNECAGSVDERGWTFEVDSYEDLSGVVPGSLAILFAEDHYGETAQSVGPVTGYENIVAIGWLGEEIITQSPKQGRTTLRIEGAQGLMKRIATPFPFGVELKAAAPTNWTEIQALTVDKALWHLITWRSTIAKVMDVYRPSSALYASALESASTTLWQQVEDLCYPTIYALPLVDRYARMFVEIEPLMVAVASRTWVDVMTITTADWRDASEVSWIADEVVSSVHASGVAIDVTGAPLAYFGVAPGTVAGRTGDPQPADLLLLADEADVLEKAQLLYAKENNPLRGARLELAGNNRLIDIAPRQSVTWNLSGNTRGLTYSGKWQPVAVEFVRTAESGFMRTNATLDAYTTPGVSVVEIIPGDGDTNIPGQPPIPPLPPLPPIDVIIPGEIGDDELSVGPSTILIGTSNFGVLYTTTFNTDDPQWYFMNSGLSSLYSFQRFYRAPSGAILTLIKDPATVRGADYLFWTSGLGGAWAELASVTSLGISGKLIAFGVNPNADEEIVLAASNGNAAGRIYLGDTSGLDLTASGLDARNRLGDITYNAAKWFLTHSEENTFTSAAWSTISAAGAILTNTTNWGRVNDRNYWHRRGGDNLYVWNESNSPWRIPGNDGAAAVACAVGAQQFADNPCALAVSPTGQFLMGGSNSGVIGHRSSDYGATMAAVDASLGVGYTRWENCASDNAFIAATTQSLKYTPDWGTTWVDKSGNLPSVAPLCAITHILFVSW